MKITDEYIDKLLCEAAEENRILDESKRAELSREWYVQQITDYDRLLEEYKYFEAKGMPDIFFEVDEGVDPEEQVAFFQMRISAPIIPRDLESLTSAGYSLEGILRYRLMSFDDVKMELEAYRQKNRL